MVGGFLISTFHVVLPDFLAVTKLVGPPVPRLEETRTLGHGLEQLLNVDRLVLDRLPRGLGLLLPLLGRVHLERGLWQHALVALAELVDDRHGDVAVGVILGLLGIGQGLQAVL